MTVDIRPPMPGTAASLMGPVRWCRLAYRPAEARPVLAAAPSPVWMGRQAKVPSEPSPEEVGVFNSMLNTPLQPDGMSGAEALRGTPSRAPAGTTLVCGARDHSGARAASAAGDAGVKSEPGDHGVRVAGVGVDGDPGATT